MHSRLLIILIAYCCCSQAHAQKDSIDQRIILIGDAGELTKGKHPVIDAVKQQIPFDDKTTIIYLGDNIYQHGLPDAENRRFDQARSVLDTQLMIADGTPAQVYMIPGNHDWDDGGEGGYAAILRQQAYAAIRENSRVHYYPKEGCPGPIEVSIGTNIVLIMFDSQWWLHPYEKPGIESDCDTKTKEQLVSNIAAIASQHSGKLILIASHHPFKSTGPHGGLFRLRQHLFPLTDFVHNAYLPLPVIGSLYPLTRSVFGSPQDISHPDYDDMIDRITNAVKSVAPNVIFIAGHEHNLQLIRDSSYNYIVSGGGCKDQRVSKNRKSLFAKESTGFVVLDVSKDKTVTANFYTVNDEVRKAYSAMITDFSRIPPAFLQTTETPAIDQRADSVTAIPDPRLRKLTGLQQYLRGANYRETWRTPVTLKVLQPNSFNGGLKVLHAGPSPYSSSLLLSDATNKKWLLKNINRNGNYLLPKDLQLQYGKEMIRDFRSALFPWSAAVMSSLLQIAGLPSAELKYYYADSNLSLGYYNKLFEDQVVSLEEENPLENTPVLSSAQLFSKMLEEPFSRPATDQIIKARLLQILTGNFEHHADQWTWYRENDKSNARYQPILRPGGNAFFNSKGKQAGWFATRESPYIRAYTDRIKKIKWAGYGGRDFDRLLLNEVSAKQWAIVAKELQILLTSARVHEAFNDVRPLTDTSLLEKLTKHMVNRIDAVEQIATSYATFLSRRVNIAGTNKDDRFLVTTTSDSLRVRVYNGKDSSAPYYDRSFDPAVTKEIRLYGLNGSDYFTTEQGPSSTIKLRMIGGKGNDTFNIRGSVESLLYDLKNDSNHVLNAHRAKNRFSKSWRVNESALTGFEYTRVHYPQVHGGYHSDYGSSFGAGFLLVTQGFRVKPEAMRQSLAIRVYTERAFELWYKGNIDHFTRNLDLVTEAKVGIPRFFNYFGLGNNANATQQHSFYRIRQKAIESSLLLRKRLLNVFQLMGGICYMRYDSDPKNNQNNILNAANAFPIGNPSTEVQQWMGLLTRFIIDNRNHPLLPGRGVYWNNEFLTAKQFEGRRHYSALRSAMTIYVSRNKEARFLSIVRIGGGKILSKDFAFYQAMPIGNNELPGFRPNRYLGKSTLYAGLQLKYRIATISGSFLSGPVGLTANTDAGRVWLNGEHSTKWHSAFGGGIYFTPFNQFVIEANISRAGTDRLYQLKCGVLF